MDYTIRNATPADADAIKELLPRLANFSIPPGRTAEQLWNGDRELLIEWECGERECIVLVVTPEQGDSGVLGACIVTLREEMFSHQPSAHLEVLVIDDKAEGRGIGRALLNQAQTAAREAGAQSMSLHVFSSNTRARSLYEKEGFDSELLRYHKPL